MAAHRKIFVTLGMFIVDEFEFLDEDGKATGQTRAAQIGGGGTYAAIGARIWLSPQNVGMVLDRGAGFAREMQSALDEYGGDELFHFRDNPDRTTTRAVNKYRGDLRGFDYLTPRIRITPKDTLNTPLERAEMLHFICSPSRAAAILAEVSEIAGWTPRTLYEPIPDLCVPAELPALIKILPDIHILSPNADEALSLLSESILGPLTRDTIEQAAYALLKHGVKEAVIIRAGATGVFVLVRGAKEAYWVPAFWSEDNPEAKNKVVDVTGAGNAFLGGLAAGLYLGSSQGGLEALVLEATLYATVSASFTIEQPGLPRLDSEARFGRVGMGETWNGDVAVRRLNALRDNVQRVPLRSSLA
ncbi:Ribokinase-like protein [Auriculariales sp. MPI-PUGE-AT-0066]|nr:Ribokinase-like protein [Auriculariales sp. MPI-PUGE-AT-0066]